MKPQFLTFTGVDDHTDFKALRALSQQYPIEWGVLFSPKRQGEDPRYPAGRILEQLQWASAGLNLAAHLCGRYADDVMQGDFSVRSRTPSDLRYFHRIQINHADPTADKAARFGALLGSRAILQTRDAAFPTYGGVDWLFDASGGQGIAPSSWPAHPSRDRLVGYAGGINPDNVLAVITAIRPTGPYWLDMESGVRTNNRFDLAKCRRVCELVFDEVSA